MTLEVKFLLFMSKYKIFLISKNPHLDITIFKLQ